MFADCACGTRGRCVPGGDGLPFVKVRPLGTGACLPRRYAHTHTHTHTHTRTHTHTHNAHYTLFNTSGKINLENTLTRWKLGTGQLIAESTKTLIVIPLWHVGMEEIHPTRSLYIPQLFKKRATKLLQP